MQDKTTPQPEAERPKTTMERLAKTESYLEADVAALNETTQLLRSLWLAYITLLTYLFITVGSVTPEMLFFDRSIILPVLNIELPLVGFFLVAPTLFLIQHWYFLIQLCTLAQRVLAFRDKIQPYEADGMIHIPGENQPVYVEQNLRRCVYKNATERLHTFVVLQCIARVGNEGIPRLWIYSLSWFSWISIAFAPLAVLLFMQIKFLPYHHHWITWVHRALLMVDLGLLWVLWRYTSRHMKRRYDSNKYALRDILKYRRDKKFWKANGKFGAGILCSLLCMFLSLGVAVYPGEWLFDRANSLRFLSKEYFGCRQNPDPQPFYGDNEEYIPHYVSAVEALVKGGRFLCYGLFSNTIILTDKDFSTNKETLNGKDFYELTKIEDDRRAEDAKSLYPQSAFTHYIPMHLLIGRDLRSAILTRTSLMRTDFTNADLTGADLRKSDLRRSLFKNAKLAAAKLGDARLDDVNFWKASAQGADFALAHLKDADFTMADLSMANFRSAVLEGASFRSASLEGASFSGAWLRNAHFEGRLLSGIWFDNADLHCTDFTGAQYADLGYMAKGGCNPFCDYEAQQCQKRVADYLASNICHPFTTPYNAPHALFNQIASRHVEDMEQLRFLYARLADDAACPGAVMLTERDRQALLRDSAVSIISGEAPAR